MTWLPSFPPLRPVGKQFLFSSRTFLFVPFALYAYYIRIWPPQSASPSLTRPRFLPCAAGGCWSGGGDGGGGTMHASFLLPCHLREKRIPPPHSLRGPPSFCFVLGASAARQRIRRSHLGKDKESPENEAFEHSKYGWERSTFLLQETFLRIQLSLSPLGKQCIGTPPSLPPSPTSGDPFLPSPPMTPFFSLLCSHIPVWKTGKKGLHGHSRQI